MNLPDISSLKPFKYPTILVINEDKMLMVAGVHPVPYVLWSETVLRVSPKADKIIGDAVKL